MRPLGALLAALCAGCAAGMPVASGYSTSDDALLRAARSIYVVRVYSDASGWVDGRIHALGQGRYRIGAERIASTEIDSLFVRRTRFAWQPPAAGAAIGAVVGMFAGEAWSGLRETPPTQWRWLTGGALLGAAAGLAFSAESDEEWQRWWPPR